MPQNLQHKSYAEVHITMSTYHTHGVQ